MDISFLWEEIWFLAAAERGGTRRGCKTYESKLKNDLSVKNKLQHKGAWGLRRLRVRLLIPSPVAISAAGARPLHQALRWAWGLVGILSLLLPLPRPRLAVSLSL